MSSMTRAQIIALAIARAGRKGQAISLTSEFDFILQRMSEEYPLLRNISHPFTTVASQSWIALPSDYRFREQCFYSTYELDWLEPETYFYYLQTFTDTASTPNCYTVVEDESRLYFWNKPSAATAGVLYYSGIHPKVEKTLSFTSGGTYEIKRGDVITGVTSSRTMTVNFVRVTSGSWAGGDAAGILLGTPSGVMVAENLNVGANTNVATIAGDATTADNFQHFFGEKFDEVIVEGLAWKCLELIANKDAQEKVLMKDKKKDFEDLLTAKAIVKGRRGIRTVYRNF